MYVLCIKYSTGENKSNLSYRYATSPSCGDIDTAAIYEEFVILCIFIRAVKRLKILIGLITGFCGLIMINHILQIFSVYFVRT